LQHLSGQEGEPALDLVDPRGSGRGEVHVEAGMAGQLPTDCRCLVGGEVVADEVNVQLGRHCLVDRDEELLVLGRSVPAVQLTDHRRVGDVERGERAGRGVPHVVVAAAPGTRLIGQAGQAALHESVSAICPPWASRPRTAAQHRCSWRRPHMPTRSCTATHTPASMSPLGLHVAAPRAQHHRVPVQLCDGPSLPFPPRNGSSTNFRRRTLARVHGVDRWSVRSGVSVRGDK
jgi:hypothetical protein